MRRFIPFKMVFLGVVSSLVLVFGMAISTGTASAHTASAQTPASAQNASTGCGAFGINQCSDFGFNNCDFEFNDCGFGFNNFGFNNCNSLEGFVGGDQFSPFENCSFGFNNFGFNNCDSFFNDGFSDCQFFVVHHHHHHHHRHHRDCDGDFDSDC